MPNTLKLAVLLLVSIFASCTTLFNNGHLGSAHYGKNKIVKTPENETVAEEKSAPKTKFKIKETELEINEELEKFQPNISQEYANLETIETDSFENIGNKNQLKEIIESIQTRRNTSTIVRPAKRSGILSEDEGDVATILIIVIVLYALGILAIILLFYFIIKLINEAANDTSEQFGCYVATMAYGSYDHPKVLVLRNFRDDYLAKRKWGRHFIDWYYRNSPSFVKFYQRSKFVNVYLRMHLNVLVFLIGPFFKIKK